MIGAQSDFTKAFSFIVDRGDVILSNLGEHVIISVIAIGIAVGIGAPIGVLLGHIHRFSFLAINVSNIGRALPSLGVLAILLAATGVGNLPVIIALIVLGVPPILTNSYVAIDEVDADVVDAARGIGLRPMQVLAKVELPLALPLIFAGIRTSAVFIVATATLAGIFGGGGLGVIINDRESYHLSGVIGASYVLILLAFAAQGLFIVLEWLVTPAGIRAAQGRRGPLRRQAKVVLDDTGETAEDLDGGSADESEVSAEPELEKGSIT